MIGFDVFMSNPSWKAIYDNAPTELLKEYYRLKFEMNNDFGKVLEEDSNAKIKAIKSQFTNVEWQYLIDTTENITAKVYYKMMMK